ncbi:MAG: dihydropteroate synthase [Phycisphaerales bacterium]|nr:dihydropteroate synthase [Phycisphaerales bacterium]
MTTQGTWRLAHDRELDLSVPRFMGILNVTPDSFSDGGHHATLESAVAHARRLIDEGADIIDIGGESTRPGAERVSVEDQILRVVPVVQALRREGVAVPISVDTTRLAVAERALEAGADAINDVAAATEDPAILPLVAARGAGLIMMHRLAPPGHDRYSTEYESDPEYGADPDGVVDAVCEFLIDRADAAHDAGVTDQALVLDPGLGFGKTVSQNYRLIASTARLLEMGYPILSAASRKSFTGAAVPGERVAVEDRLPASLAITLLHYQAGVRLFRVHDVAAHRRALAALTRIDDPGGETR